MQQEKHRHRPPLPRRPQGCLPEGRCVCWILLCIGRRIGPAPIIHILWGSSNACRRSGEADGRGVPAQLLLVLSEQASGLSSGASMFVARASTAADALCGMLSAQQNQHVAR